MVEHIIFMFVSVCPYHQDISALKLSVLIFGLLIPHFFEDKVVVNSYKNNDYY